VRPGRQNRKVTLWRNPQQTDDADGFWEPLTPSDFWVQIQALSPQDNGRVILSQVNMRYHAQVTVDTAIYLGGTTPNARVAGDRLLLVKGVQDVDDMHDELNCLCEEVVR
jgi:head-tail adaptor